MSTEEIEPHQLAVDDFNEADMQYQRAESLFRAQFAAELDALDTLREDRNAKLVKAQKELRQLVNLHSDSERGPDGSPTKIVYGNFEVNSVTKRSFDGNTLYRLANSKGVLQQLLNLTYMEKDGSVARAFQQVFDVAYQRVKEFLHELGPVGEEIIKGAYVENESTAAVKGPKRLMGLGDKEK